MSYDRLVGERNARAVQLLETNPSVRAFVMNTVQKLAAFAADHKIAFDRLAFDETFVVNATTGDEQIRARIIRRVS